ncbi:MAG TPA: hypothetical protein PLV58_02570 [Campylobacterales bacterium]|nr:hypothetical protein [Campylobacterales bacterium]
MVKTYLTNYFTFGDVVSLYFLVGKESLLCYADELGIKERVSHLIDKIENREGG